MNTRLLQTVSLAVLGVCGVVGLFAPEVLLSAINMAFVTPHWPVQLLAAAWLGLATLNWSTRGFAGGRPGPLAVLVVFGLLAAAYGYLLLAPTPGGLKAS